MNEDVSMDECTSALPPTESDAMEDAEMLPRPSATAALSLEAGVSGIHVRLALGTNSLAMSAFPEQHAESPKTPPPEIEGSELVQNNAKRRCLKCSKTFGAFDVEPFELHWPCGPKSDRSGKRTGWQNAGAAVAEASSGRSGSERSPKRRRRGGGGRHGGGADHDELSKGGENVWRRSDGGGEGQQAVSNWHRSTEGGVGDGIGRGGGGGGGGHRADYTDRLSDELLVYLQPEPSDAAKLERSGLTSLRKVFEAVKATCRQEMKVGLPGVVAVPRGMLLNWLKQQLSNESRLQVPEALRDGVLVEGGVPPKQWIGYQDAEHRRGSRPPLPPPVPPQYQPPPPQQQQQQYGQYHQQYGQMPPHHNFAPQQQLHHHQQQYAPPAPLPPHSAGPTYHREGGYAYAPHAPPPQQQRHPQHPQTGAVLSARDASFLADLEGTSFGGAGAAGDGASYAGGCAAGSAYVEYGANDRYGAGGYESLGSTYGDGGLSSTHQHDNGYRDGYHQGGSSTGYLQQPSQQRHSRYERDSGYGRDAPVGGGQQGTHFFGGSDVGRGGYYGANTGSDRRHEISAGVGGGDAWKKAEPTAASSTFANDFQFQSRPAGYGAPNGHLHDGNQPGSSAAYQPAHRQTHQPTPQATQQATQAASAAYQFAGETFSQPPPQPQQPPPPSSQYSLHPRYRW